MGKKRLLSLDFCRVIAFAGVFLFHFFQEISARRTGFNVNFTIGMFSIPAVAVALFFLLSGFGLMKSGKFSVKDFYLRRFTKILIPLILVTVVYAIYRFLLTGHSPFPKASLWSVPLLFTGLSNYLSALGTGFGFSLPNFGIGEWFIGALVLMYLLFPLLRILVKKFSWKFILAVTVLYIFWVLFYPWPYSIFFDLIAKLFPFIIGMGLKQAWEKGSHPLFSKGRVRNLSLIACGIVLLSSFLIHLPDPGNFIEYFITLDAVAVFYLLFPLNNVYDAAAKKHSSVRRLGAVITFFASLEYGMFLVHHITIVELYLAFPENLTTAKGILILFIPAVLLTFLFGWLVHLTEKIDFAGIFSPNKKKPAKEFKDRNTVSAENQVTKSVFFEHENGTGKRVMFVGNSITLHRPKAEIGWLNSWGMAASAKEKDYVHLLESAIREKDPEATFCITQVAAWERVYQDGESLFQNYTKAHDFGADILIMRLIENCPKKDFDSETFRKEYGKLIDFLNPSGKARVIITSGFWPHPGNATVREFAEEKHFTFVDLSDLGVQAEMRAEGLFEHSGVAYHPGDKGMQAIAERIIKVL